VDYDQWFISQVEKNLAQIERGEVLKHEEVGGRLEKLLTRVLTAKRGAVHGA
jgi:predicted transcriptional regulator